MPSPVECFGGTVPAPGAGVAFALLVLAGIVIDRRLLLRQLRGREPFLGLAGHVKRHALPEIFSTRILLILLALNLATWLLTSTLHQWSVLPESFLLWGGIGLQVVCLHLGSLLGVNYVLRRTGRSWSRTFWMGAQRSVVRDLRLGLSLYTAAIPPFLLAALCWRFLLLQTPIDPAEQHVVALFVDPERSFAARCVLAVLAVGVAPVAEEVLFRGLLLPLLLRWVSPLRAVFAVSLIFAAIHFHLPSFVPLLVISIAFSCAYLHTGSIRVSIVMHMLFNAVSLLVFLSLM